MMHREFRFNLLLVVLFMGLGLAVALMRGDEQRVYAEAVASDTGALTTPPGAIYLPVVSQGQSSAQEPHTPTATVTTNPSDPATNTPTPTATATVDCLRNWRRVGCTAVGNPNPASHSTRHSSPGHAGQPPLGRTPGCTGSDAAHSQLHCRPAAGMLLPGRRSF